MTKAGDILRQMADRIPEKERRFLDKATGISVQIGEVLDQKGLTQREFARMLGKKESYVSRVLAGGVNLTLKTITEMETVLGMDLVVFPMEMEDSKRDLSLVSHTEVFQPRFETRVIQRPANILYMYPKNGMRRQDILPSERGFQVKTA